MSSDIKRWLSEIFCAEVFLANNRIVEAKETYTNMRETKVKSEKRRKLKAKYNLELYEKRSAFSKEVGTVKEIRKGV